MLSKFMFVGSTLIASLLSGRNCLSLESDDYCHHHTIIRATTVIANSPDDMSDNEQVEEIDSSQSEKEQ